MLCGMVLAEGRDEVTMGHACDSYSSAHRQNVGNFSRSNFLFANAECWRCQANGITIRV